MLFEGLESYLSRQHGVCNIVTRGSSRPVSREAIGHWQEATGLTLPSDVRSLYNSHGGASLSWHYSICKTTEEVGHIEVNPLSELLLIDVTQDGHNGNLPFTSDDTKLVIFESSKYIGQVCLLYKKLTGAFEFDGVWMIDLSMGLHKISDSFSSYLRLAIVHLGLPEWQNLIIQRQLSPQNIIWYEIFLPKRLELDLYGDTSETESCLFEPNTQIIDLTSAQ